MRKGLGMWIMSKLVIVIFLFALLIALTGFLHVYQQKVIADTARDNTALLAEVGNTALSFQAAGGTHRLEPFVVVEDQYQEYTVVVRTVENDRVVFLFAWGNREPNQLVEDSAFSSASALDTPPEVSEDSGEYDEGTERGYVWLFDGNPDTVSFDRMDGGDPLSVRPSLDAGKRDNYLLFYRNRNVFCIASSSASSDTVKESVSLLAACCTEEGGDDVDDVECDVTP